MAGFWRFRDGRIAKTTSARTDTTRSQEVGTFWTFPRVGPIVVHLANTDVFAHVSLLRNKIPLSLPQSPSIPTPSVILLSGPNPSHQHDNRPKQVDSFTGPRPRPVLQFRLTFAVATCHRQRARLCEMDRLSESRSLSRIPRRASVSGAGHLGPQLLLYGI